MATFSGGQAYNPDKAGNINLPDVPQAQLSTPLAPVYTNWAQTLGGGPTGGQPDPYDYFRMRNIAISEGIQRYPELVNMQLGMLPQITSAQMAASQQAFPLQLSQQQQASQAAFEEQMRQYGIAGPQIAAQNMALMNQYAPQYADIMRAQGRLTNQQLWEQATAYNPDFYPTYHALAGRIGEGLEAGYDLGSDLEREVQQGIRGAQAARGNYLGPAPTAAEAFGKGQAATNLYNTRIGQAQNFLQGRTPSDLMMSMMPGFGPGGGAMGMVGQAGQPSPGLISPSVAPTAGLAAQAAANYLQNPIQDYAAQGGQAYGTYMGAVGTYAGQSLDAQSKYNTAMIQSAAANNEGTFNMYDKQFEQFLFDQGVSQGIYSQPGVSGGGSSGMMGMLGSGIGALGSIGGALLGGGGGAAAGVGGAAAGAAGGLAGAAGGIGGALAGAGTAIAGGVSAAAGAVGAAASAAAAAFACWLARAVIPERWKEFRKFLFTRASASFRRKYLYGARRLAGGLTEADKAQIREVMEKCLK